MDISDRPGSPGERGQSKGNPRPQIVTSAMKIIDRGQAAAILSLDAGSTASGLVPVVWWCVMG